MAIFLKQSNSVLIHFESLKLFFSYSALETAYGKLFFKVTVKKINFRHWKESTGPQHLELDFVNLSSFFAYEI